MRVRQKLILHFLPLITLLSIATNTLASCPRIFPGPPCAEYWTSEAVFIGVANRVVNVLNNTESVAFFGPYSRSTVYFTIEEAFKGVGGTAVVLNLDHCGHRFKEGERYLVYANRNPNNNELNVRAGNTRTQPLSAAAEDLQYIRGLSSAEPGSRIYGKVAQHTQNVKKSEIEFESLPDIKVTLEGNNQRQEVFTDSQGRYEFRRLPAGAYVIRAEIPSHLKYNPQRIEVTGHKCVPFNIEATQKGQVMGRVLNEKGEPLVSVPVSLVSADAALEEILAEDKEKILWTFAYTNREGRAGFSNLAPGRYLLVINRTEFERSRGSETARTLPRLFYPGVSEVSGATVIVVRKDSEARVYDFRLPIQ